jgi:hypothetical protein
VRGESGPRAAGPGSLGRGLNSRPGRKRWDYALRCGERSPQRAGASWTCVAPAFHTPFEPSPHRTGLNAAFGSRPAAIRRPQQRFRTQFRPIPP